MSEFLPCPFCGKKADVSNRQDESLWSHDIVTWYSVGCRECDYSMESCDYLDGVVSRWNSRVAVAKEIVHLTAKCVDLEQRLAAAEAEVAKWKREAILWSTARCGCITSQVDEARAKEVC